MHVNTVIRILTTDCVSIASLAYLYDILGGLYCGSFIREISDSPTTISSCTLSRMVAVSTPIGPPPACSFEPKLLLAN